MAIILGIHIGHHSSCAVVKDGFLVAAIALERITRKKHDGRNMLTNEFPVMACLQAAGLKLKDVDLIVSCFQGAAVGGVGLQVPLIHPQFDLFDPLDIRHRVISHHLAHAACAFGCSGFDDAAVLICDLGGSTTESGADFEYSFSEYQDYLSQARDTLSVKTESLSMYGVDHDGFSLKYREFSIPHSTPEIFVHSAASLYDNVSRSVFRSNNAHGQLMALAAYHDNHTSQNNTNNEMLSTVGGRVIFRNDWQLRQEIKKEPLGNAGFAYVTQKSLELALSVYAEHIKGLCTSKNFCAAGGIFLNINANSQIAASGRFDRYYFPSSPHDSGIAIGCAYYGEKIWQNPNTQYIRFPVTDRLGHDISDADIRSAVQVQAPFIENCGQVNASKIAKMLADGMIIARCAGRAEFGPRALGGRSLLASPLLKNSKDQLNKIKNRQDWRPVAPIVLASRIEQFFDGPHKSPYMNYAHEIRGEYRSDLKALYHPDCSTRVQSLHLNEDADLYELIEAFSDITNYPILVNTSLNGKGEPIIDTADQAIAFFRRNKMVDALLLNRHLIVRCDDWISSSLSCRVAPASDVVITTVFGKDGAREFIIKGSNSIEIPPNISPFLTGRSKNLTLENFLESLEVVTDGNHKPIVADISEFFNQGFLRLERQ